MISLAHGPTPRGKRHPKSPTAACTHMNSYMHMGIRVGVSSLVCSGIQTHHESFDSDHNDFFESCYLHNHLKLEKKN